MPSATMPSAPRERERGYVPVRKLVLCFDGTGNTFSGSSGDTNIVKLYDKFNRDDPYQYHYYQTGIGTYDVNSGSVNKGFIGSIRSMISRTLDQGFGTSFDHHVMAGYKFLMNHYNAGVKTFEDPTGELTSDKIYMFGFSRGAYTARFLARMVNTVGLLSMGNDEMVPFAYQLYQRYEQGAFVPRKSLVRVGTEVADAAKAGASVVKERVLASTENSTVSSLLGGGGGGERSQLSQPPTTAEAQETVAEVAASAAQGFADREAADAATRELVNEIRAFRSTFCREVKVYFLGIFDCVNSVAVLENPHGSPATVLGTAKHVRHAVAADEFRVKFKPSLLHQDVQDLRAAEDETVKEVWFPGNHGDVGGGWPICAPPQGFLDTLRRYFSGDRQRIGTSADPSQDDFQLSDIPLDWMIRELELVNAMNIRQKRPEWAITFSPRKEGFKRTLRRKEKLRQAMEGMLHDTMRIGAGINPFKVVLWNIMEYLPIISRYELDKDGNWVKRRFPLNRGSARDIPRGAILHHALIARLAHEGLQYRPRNNHGDGTKPCLLDAASSSRAAAFREVREGGDRHRDELHRVYTFQTAA